MKLDTYYILAHVWMASHFACSDVIASTLTLAIAIVHFIIYLYLKHEDNNK